MMSPCYSVSGPARRADSATGEIVEQPARLAGRVAGVDEPPKIGVPHPGGMVAGERREAPKRLEARIGERAPELDPESPSQEASEPRARRKLPQRILALGGGDHMELDRREARGLGGRRDSAVDRVPIYQLWRKIDVSHIFIPDPYVTYRYVLARYVPVCYIEVKNMIEDF